MRPIFGIGLATVVATLAMVGSAWAATGTVLYAYQTPYVYPNGLDAPGNALGRASSTVTYDRCYGVTGCRWSAMAFATRFAGCDPYPYNDPYPYGVWNSTAQTGDGTLRSGERRFAMGTPNGVELHTVCLYVLRHHAGAEDDVTLLHGRSIDPEPTPTPVTPPVTPRPATPAPVPVPAPSGTTPTAVTPPLMTPPSVTSSGSTTLPVTTAPLAVVTPLILTRALAKHTAKVLLRKKYASWRKGTNKRVSCKRTFSSVYSCSAKWRYGSRSRKAALTVRVKNNKASARII